MMKNNKKKKIILFIVLIFSLYVLVVFVPGVKFFSYDKILIDFNKGFYQGTAQESDTLYVNGKEVCSFSTMPSIDLYKIWYRGKFYSLEESLEKKIVTLKQLQSKSVPCS